MRKVVLTSELLRRVESDSRYRAAVDAGTVAASGDREWRERGACARTDDPDVFFPALPDDLEPARRLCRTCSVTGPCLAEALSRTEIDGVWGGTTSAERRSMRAVWRHRSLQDASVN